MKISARLSSAPVSRRRCAETNILQEQVGFRILKQCLGLSICESADFVAWPAYTYPVGQKLQSLGFGAEILFAVADIYCSIKRVMEQTVPDPGFRFLAGISSSSYFRNASLGG